MPTRRSRGSGSVRYNAARGRYEAVLVVGGTKHTRTVPSPEPNERRKREAERVLAQMVERFGGTNPRSHTVASFLEEWLEFRTPTLAYGTARGHRSRVEAHIVPVMGKIRLDRLETRHVDLLVAATQKKGLAPSTVALVRKTLNTALWQAVRWGLINKNPVTLSRAPRVPFQERTTLSSKEARAFIEHIKGHRLEAAWTIAACIGLRSGEIRGLTWEAIKGDELEVRQTLAYRPGFWELTEPKTEGSARKVYLPAFVVTLLERRRQAQRFEERSVGYANPMGLIFTQPDGYPISSQWMRTELHAILEAAGLPRITVHDLRHAAASLLLAEGVSVRATQQILGHKSPRITLEVYAHSDAEQREAAAQSLEDWRFGR